MKKKDPKSPPGERGDAHETGDTRGEWEIVKKMINLTDGTEAKGDDTAVIPQNTFFPDEKMVLLATTDTLDINPFMPWLEKGERRGGIGGEDLGWHLAAVNLSDIAAMGGKPVAALLSISLPKNLVGVFLDRFVEGFVALLDRYDVALVGGDTKQGCGVVGATVLGTANRERVLTRGGAKPGDGVYVTGRLGEKIAHFMLGDVKKTLVFNPRVREGEKIAEAGGTGALDVSDGLAISAYYMAESSGVDIALDNIPLSSLLEKACETHEEAVERAIYGGGDYELLFTFPPEKEDDLFMAMEKLKCEVNRIGTVQKKKSGRPRVFLADKNGKKRLLRREGYQHFRKNSLWEKKG